MSVKSAIVTAVSIITNIQVKKQDIYLYQMLTIGYVVLAINKEMLQFPWW